MSRPSSARSRSSIVYIPKTRVSTGFRTSIRQDIVTSSGTVSWENAINDVLPVLKIQYRSDVGVSTFLNDPEKISRLKYSSIAKTDYNRRCIREECDFEMYSPPRARRIAKEVAIDYIRKFLDEQEDQLEMVRKIQDIQCERDEVVDQVHQVQAENDELQREKDRLFIESRDVQDQKNEIESNLMNVNDELSQTKKELGDTQLNKKDTELNLARSERDLEKSKDENSQLRDDIGKLKVDYDKARKDNDGLRNECSDAYKQIAERREDISQLKQALESARAESARSSATADRYSAQNKELCNNNKNLNEKNLGLRDDVNVFRAREEEMRTLVNIQTSILSPEKCKSDLDGVVRKANSPQPTKEKPSIAESVKTPEPVREVDESEEANADESESSEQKAD